MLHGGASEQRTDPRAPRAPTRAWSRRSSSSSSPPPSRVRTYQPEAWSSSRAGGTGPLAPNDAAGHGDESDACADELRYVVGLDPTYFKRRSCRRWAMNQPPERSSVTPAQPSPLCHYHWRRRRTPATPRAPSARYYGLRCVRFLNLELYGYLGTVRSLYKRSSLLTGGGATRVHARYLLSHSAKGEKASAPLSLAAPVSFAT